MLKKIILTITFSLISFVSFANGFAGFKYGLSESHKINVEPSTAGFMAKAELDYKPNSFGIYGGIEQQDFRFFGEYNFKTTDSKDLCLGPGGAEGPSCVNVKAGFSTILVGADYMIEVVPKGKILVGGVAGLYKQTWESIDHFQGDLLLSDLNLDGLTLALSVGYKYSFDPVSIEVGYRYGILTDTFPGEEEKTINVPNGEGGTDEIKVKTKLDSWDQLNIGVSYNF